MSRIGVRAVSAASLLFLVSQIAHTQTIPSTIASADSEAATFPTYPASVPTQVFTGYTPLNGNSDRQCVDLSSHPAFAWGSVRSGDFVVRGLVYVQAGRGNKILWLPMHGHSPAKPTLLLRAARIGHPEDSLRITEPWGAHQPRRDPNTSLYGYPSLIDFPTAGQWLVVATAGSDWGCVVLDVVSSSASGM